MNELPYYYTVLFNAATDALASLERQDYGTARELLVRGQRAAEDAYLKSEQHSDRD